ncbi:MAG: hypothetical protein GX456_00855 [Verrucomicrobia bacterium]|nr:hypothetical protein [Verrucomicrobiota bacterium]
MCGGRREALGVRQLAAALFHVQTTCLNPNNEPVTLFASLLHGRGLRAASTE